MARHDVEVFPDADPLRAWRGGSLLERLLDAGLAPGGPVATTEADADGALALERLSAGAWEVRAEDAAEAPAPPLPSPDRPGGITVKSLVLFLLGLVIGVVGTGLTMAVSAPKLMTHTQTSPVGVEETVARLEQVAKADGWKVLGIRKLHESVKEHTGEEVRPVHLVDLCEPHHASKILGSDDSRVVSVFMPCTVSVHQSADGKTQVTSTNARLLGALFGGVVKEVMGGPVADSQEKFVAAVIAEEAGGEGAGDESSGTGESGTDGR